MKLLLLTIITLSFTIKIYSQSNFDNGFKSGFKSGYCYSNQSSGICFPPLAPFPPLPQINESRDSYNDGYNRGFLYGQARRSQEEKNPQTERNSTPKFNDYIPQNPVQSMAAVGIMTQRIYDGRKNWIQQRIDNLNDIYSEVFNEYTLPKNINLNNIKNTYYTPFINYINSIGNIDFAKDYQFNIIQNEFKKIENSFYEGRNELIKSTVKTNLNVNSTSSNNRSINIYVYRPWALDGFLLKIKVYVGNVLIGKLKNNSGCVFNVPNTAYLKLKFQGFATRREAGIYIEPGKNNYYVRLDVDSNGFNWSLKPSSQGLSEFNQMKHKDSY